MIQELQILYQDDSCLAINKPAGLPVHATVDPNRPHVHGMLEAQVGEKLVLHHRLDQDTTGVLLFGRDPSLNQAFTDLFRDRKIKKTYMAVVEGRWLEQWKKVESFIVRSGSSYANRARGAASEYACTEFRVINTSGERTLLEAKPETGRTHQIRLHCQSKGHAICGDRVYGRRDTKGVPMALHARVLEFLHPRTGAGLRIEAPIPETFKDYWARGLI